MFYVFKNCKHFIRTIPLLQYDEHKVEDVDTTQEEHIYDMWRYVLMSNPITPQFAADKDEFYKSALSVFLDIKKEDLTTRTVRPRMEIITED